MNNFFVGIIQWTWLPLLICAFAAVNVLLALYTPYILMGLYVGVLFCVVGWVGKELCFGRTRL